MRKRLLFVVPAPANEERDMSHDEFAQLQYDIAFLAGCATAYLGDAGNLDLFEQRRLGTQRQRLIRPSRHNSRSLT